MKTNEKAPLKSRRMMEQLCEGVEEFWHLIDGQRVVNVYALHDALTEWGTREKRKIPAQSTLARNYSGETENFSRNTAQVLSDYFRVPVAIITGDLEISGEAWGMDVTLSEIRWVMLMRELTPEQRTAIYNSIRAMLPPDTPSPRLPPGASPLLKVPKH